MLYIYIYIYNNDMYCVVVRLCTGLVDYNVV